MNDFQALAHGDMVGLLSGQIGRAETLDLARHLRSCRICTEELVEVAVAHAALTSATRTEAALAAQDSANHDPESSGPSRAGAGPEGSEGAVLPALTIPTERRPSQHSKVHRGRVSVAAAAAAVVVVLGLLSVGTLRVVHPPTQPVVARAALQPLSAPASVTGSVTVVADRSARELTVQTRDLAHPPVRHFYEVWLLDPATQKMLPMGVLSPSGTGSYAVGASIMAGYSAVDVSLQTDDGNPAHSQISVLRASLGTVTT